MTATAYQQLESRFHRLYALRGAAGVLHWDMASMMPAGGGADRAEQLAAVNVTCHEILADPRIADLLDEAESGQMGGGAAGALDSWQRANLAEMRRQWTHATAMDARLVEALTKAGTACESLWRKARPEANFAMVLPATSDSENTTTAAADPLARALEKIARARSKPSRETAT